MQPVREATELMRYIPRKARARIERIIGRHSVVVTVTRERHSKLGDYSPPRLGGPHRVSVNGNLNRYAFLITLVHELAHMITHERYGRRGRPHGHRWKDVFREALIPFIAHGCFPPSVEKPLRMHLEDPMATTATDAVLARALARYDRRLRLFLDEVPDGKFFRTENGMVFRKGEKIRTRYRCLRLKNKRVYYVSATAPVIRVAPAGKEASQMENSFKKTSRL